MPGHPHLVDRAARRSRCVCAACAVAFDGRIGGREVLVHRRAERLDEVAAAIDDATWKGLGAPMGLAYLAAGGDGGDGFALLPAADGIVDGKLAKDTWRAIAGLSTRIAWATPVVEGVLVDGRAAVRRAWLVSIDVCYQLAEVLRTAASEGDGGATYVDGWLDRLDD